jgi:hypothetical protein
MAAMKTRRFGAVWSVFLTLALLTTIAWPAITRGAQDTATPVATPAVSESDLPPVDPLSTAGVVPAEALFYVAVTVDQGSSQWTQTETLIGRLGLDEMLPQATEEVATEALPGEADFGALLDGEVAFVVVDFALLLGTEEPPTTASDAEQPDGLAFVIAARDPDAADALARELTEQDALDRGGRVLEVEEGGETIYYAPGDEFESGTAYVRLGDLLVVSATPDDLAPFVATAAGQTPALADDASFTRLSGELSSEFLAFGFVNGPAFRAAFEALMASEVMGETPPDSLGDLDALLASLEVYTAFVVWADEPGFRLDTLTVAAEGGALPPVPANFDPTFDERVPADTLLFVDGYDLGPTLAPQLDAAAVAIAQVAAEDPTFPFELPVDADEVEQAAAVWELVGRFLAFNPRTDLVDQLVGEWGLALSFDLEDPTLVDGVMVSGVADQPRLNDAITKLAVWYNLAAVLVVVGIVSDGTTMPLDQPFGATTEEVGGALTQVIEIPIPELDATIRLQWGIVDGEFVFGFGDGFADYAAGPADVLADNPRYVAIMAELPDEHFSVVYLDLGQIIETVMPLIEEELNAAGATDGFGTPEPIVLPDLSAIQALATVAFQRDDLIGSSTLLMIAEG